MEEGDASESIGMPTRLASLALFGLIGGLAIHREALAQGADASNAPPPAEAIVEAAAALVAGAETAYVSDYVSFSGRDQLGRIAFALDTNRGRAGDRYQAEHFAAMYDENAGWIDLGGSSDFPNEKGVLLGYPESPYFTLTGAPFALERVTSEKNGLGMELGPLLPRTYLGGDSTVFAMASGSATLEWNGRRIEGRVIYEFLAMRDANRLAGASLRSVLEMLSSGPEFQGLYLASEDDDFYVQLTPSTAASAPDDELMAFWARANRSLPIRNLIFGVTDVSLALGFYRWPTGWEMRWQSDCGDARLSVRSVAHETETNWVLGGFAMQAVVGDFECGAERREFFGFGELIR